MYSGKLQEIVNYLGSLNPAFTGKTFVVTEDSEFRGITDEYVNYLYARFTEEGDQTFELEEDEEACGRYTLRFNFKIVISTKVYNKDVLAILINQLSSKAKVTGAGDNAERIYEAETGEKIKTDEVYLYTIYANVETVTTTRQLMACAGSKCLALEDLC